MTILHCFYHCICVQYVFSTYNQAPLRKARSPQCGEVTDIAKTAAEGVKRLKKFVRAVGAIATADGCLLDRAHLQGFSELKIECIDKLMREDKTDEQYGINDLSAYLQNSVAKDNGFPAL